MQYGPSVSKDNISIKWSVCCLLPLMKELLILQKCLFMSLLIKQTFRELVIVYNLWIALTFKVHPTFNLGSAAYYDIYQWAAIIRNYKRSVPGRWFLNDIQSVEVVIKAYLSFCPKKRGLILYDLTISQRPDASWIGLPAFGDCTKTWDVRSASSPRERSRGNKAQPRRGSFWCAGFSSKLTCYLKFHPL